MNSVYKETELTQKTLNYLDKKIKEYDRNVKKIKENKFPM